MRASNCRILSGFNLTRAYIDPSVYSASLSAISRVKNQVIAEPAEKNAEETLNKANKTFPGICIVYRFLFTLRPVEIKHDKQNRKGTFYVERDGERLGVIEYFVSDPGREITVFHTEVDARLRGEGVGHDLVAAVVDYARSGGLKIVATCPYAKKVIDRTPGFQDVLA